MTHEEAMTSETGAASRASTSRRTLLKGAAFGAGAFWVAPTIDSLVTPAAAASGSTTASLSKATNGNNTYPAGFCTLGTGGNGPRGGVVFTRKESPTPTICATITLSTGTNITGRVVTFYQSSGTTTLTCVGSTTAANTWPSNTPGPYTFCAPILAGATNFFVAVDVSGGAGNDAYASTIVSLP